MTMTAEFVKSKSMGFFQNLSATVMTTFTAQTGHVVYAGEIVTINRQCGLFAKFDITTKEGFYAWNVPCTNLSVAHEQLSLTFVADHET